MEDMKKKEFTLLQIVMDHDTSAGNIVTDVFPEIRITYCGNHTAKTFHKDKLKAIQCKVSKQVLGGIEQYTSLNVTISLQPIFISTNV